MKMLTLILAVAVVPCGGALSARAQDAGMIGKTEWTTFAAGPERNPVLDARGADGRPLSVGWSLAADGAIALDGPPLAGDMKTTAYTIGLPVGPSVARGLVLAGSDAGYLYAVDAASGRLAWSHRLWNMAMVNPLVVGDKVLATTGNPYFNFAQTLRFAAGKRATRGPGLNGLYALDLRTGKERWHLFTQGQNMPTPTVADGTVYFASGAGVFYAVDAADGKVLWTRDIRSIDGMSSPLLADGRLFFGGSHPDLFFALDAKTGKILWKRRFANATPAGFGAATPALGAGRVIVEELVRTGDPKTPAANRVFALDPATGRSVWEAEVGRGPVPKGFATATPSVSGGTVFVSSIVDGTTHALDARTGRSLWSAKVAGAGAGLVAGPKTVYVAAGARLVALDRKDGRMTGAVKVGGHQGPATPVLAGDTLFVTNMYGWIQAVPVASVR